MELDSQQAKIPFEEFAYKEMRYNILNFTNPSEAKRLKFLAQKEIDDRWLVYQQLAAKK